MEWGGAGSRWGARSEQGLTLHNGQQTETFPHMGETSLKLVRTSPGWLRQGQMRSNSALNCTMLVEICPYSIEAGRTWPHLAQILSNSANNLPKSTKFGRARIEFGRNQPKIVEHGPSLVEIGPSVAEISPISVETGYNWSNIAQAWSKPAQSWPKPTQSGRPQPTKFYRTQTEWVDPALIFAEPGQIRRCPRTKLLVL